MKSIYKYPLPVQEKYNLELPKGSQIIRVEDIDGLFFVWAIVDTEQEKMEYRKLEIYRRKKIKNFCRKNLKIKIGFMYEVEIIP